MFYNNGSYAQGHVHYSLPPKMVNNQLESWQTGLVVFNNSDSLKTEFALNPMVQGGLLKIKVDDRLLVKTPQDVLFFSFYDEKEERYRTFNSFFTDADHAAFVEIIYEGTGYQVHGYESINIAHHINLDNGAITAGSWNKFKQYLLFNEKIYPLTRKSLWELVGNHKPSVKGLIKRRAYYIKNPKHLIAVLDYYEQLIDAEKN